MSADEARALAATVRKKRALSQDERAEVETALGLLADLLECECEPGCPYDRLRLGAP